MISDAGVKQDGKDAGQTIQGDAGKYGIYQPVANTVRIDKEIVIFNTNSTDTLVFLPNITYTYTVAAADVAADKHIKDEYGLSATIQDGVAAAISTTSATVSYSDANGIKTGSTTITAQPYVLTKQAGVAAAGYFDVTFDPTKFTKPGVYRYVISESTGASVDAGRTAAGVTNEKENYGDKRFLDVYVQNKAGSTTGECEIYGYALYEDGTNADKEFDAANRKLTAKTNGFVSNKNDASAQAYDPKEKDVDIYQTANVKVEKSITGTMGDKTNKFPFEATITNGTVTSQAKFSYQIVATGGTLNPASTSNPTKALDADGAATIGKAQATVVDNLALKDKEYVYIYGVPGKGDGTTFNNKYATITTVAVKEYNNTTDTYTVSAKYNDADVDVTTTEGTGTSKNMAKSTVGSVATQNIVFKTTEDKMLVTNSLSAISPTNVVMRYAPYLLILAAAILLLVLRRRRKSDEA